jgi:uncharacterized protein
MFNLHSLASRGNENELLQSILTGANIHYQDSSGATALHYAAVHGHESCVKVLLRAGIQHSIQDCVSLFRQHTVSYPPQNGWTPLHIAARSGRLETLVALLEAGANRNVQDNVCSPSSSHLNVS